LTHLKWHFWGAKLHHIHQPWMSFRFENSALHVRIRLETFRYLFWRVNRQDDDASGFSSTSYRTGRHQFAQVELRPEVADVLNLHFRNLVIADALFFRRNASVQEHECVGLNR